MTLMLGCNVAFLILFNLKLHRLLSSNTENQHLTRKFKRLAIRHGILISTGAISTIICPFVWIQTGFATTLYLGVVLNILSVGLCFVYNKHICCLSQCVDCCLKY